jgi:hypothetical protein
MATASALSESPATTIPNASILLGTSLTPPETVQTSIGDDIRSDLLRILRDEPKNVPDQVVPSKNLAETQKRVKSSIEPQRASSDTVKPANDKRKKRAETQNQKRQSDDTSVKILKRPQSDQQDAVECHGDTMANFKFNMGDLLKYFNR